MFTYENIQIAWYGQDGFLIKAGGKTIWVDPFQIPDNVEKADILLFSHDHQDHFSPEDISKVLKDQTIIASPFEIDIEGSHEKRVLKVGQVTEIDGIKIKSVPAYNITKKQPSGEPFHPQADERCGFLITIGDTTIYHTGDTDHIPEMKGLSPDIALVPVSGTYVMTAEEAVEAVKDINPKLAIPMHYGALVGSEEDAQYLKKNASFPVEILPKAS